MEIEYTDEGMDHVKITADDGSVTFASLSGDGYMTEIAKRAISSGVLVKAFVAPPAPFAVLARPAFMFMMDDIGITEADVFAMIAAMPDGSPKEQQDKKLAKFVFQNQETFDRDNALLNTLAAIRGLTKAELDAAWRKGEKLTW